MIFCDYYSIIVTYGYEKVYIMKNKKQNKIGEKIADFLIRTPAASILLKLLELYSVSIGFSLILTFIVGSVLAKLHYYQVTAVTYTTLTFSILGFFVLGGIFLNGFRYFCRSVKEYMFIMLTAYGIFFLTSYWGLGLKFLPISDELLRNLPSFLYNGWSNRAFENVFLPLRIFAYFQWLPDWASLTAVHLLYICMIVLFAYKGGGKFDLIHLTEKAYVEHGAAYKSAKARARYERRRKRIMRANKDKLDDADVDYDEAQYSDYLKDAFNEQPMQAVDDEPDNPDYDKQYKEYTEHAFDVSFDEEPEYEKMQDEEYAREYSEYIKDAFTSEPENSKEEYDDDSDDDMLRYTEEYKEYLKDAFDKKQL